MEREGSVGSLVAGEFTGRPSFDTGVADVPAGPEGGGRAGAERSKMGF
jgi:hypothetical protein